MERYVRKDAMWIKRAEVHYACRDACVVHGILQDQGLWGDSCGLYGSGGNFTRKYKVSSSGPKLNDAVWWGFIHGVKFMALKKH